MNNKSFSDFANTNIPKEESEIKEPNGFKREDMSGFEDLINNYSKYSEKELMQEFLRLTQEGKKNGTLNSKSLRALSETVMPMLNKKQQEMLKMYLSYID